MNQKKEIKYISNKRAEVIKQCNYCHKWLPVSGFGINIRTGQPYKSCPECLEKKRAYNNRPEAKENHNFNRKPLTEDQKERKNWLRRMVRKFGKLKKD